MCATVRPAASTPQLVASGALDAGRGAWRLYSDNRIELEGHTQAFTVNASGLMAQSVPLPAPVTPTSWSASFGSGTGLNDTGRAEPTSRISYLMLSDADEPRVYVITGNSNSRQYGDCSVGWRVSGTVDEAGAAAFAGSA